MFKDRAEAGRQLAERLASYRAQDAVVVALPRGGVATGLVVARALGLPLDILAVRKIGHPTDPEYALCAVDQHGSVLCRESEAALVDQAWLAEETERQRREAARRSRVYHAGKPPLALAGRVVVLVDDGIATGLTMRLAARVARAAHPARLVVAAPVASPEAVRALRDDADEVVLVESPEDFLGAVGAHYEHFAQVEDDEVVRLLAQVNGRAAGRGSPESGGGVY